MPRPPAADPAGPTPEQARLLRRLRRTQPWTAALGALLVVVGLAYGIWGASRFDRRVDPRVNPGFDRPVANLAFVYDPFEKRLLRTRPQTVTEIMLVGTLTRGMHFSAGFTMLLVRVFLATLAVLGGLVMLTVVVERRRLLLIIERLEREPPPAGDQSRTILPA